MTLHAGTDLGPIPIATFEESLDVICRSGAAEILESGRRDRRSTSASPTTISGHTALGFLVALLAAIRIQRTPSITVALRTLRDATPVQRTTLGITWSDEHIINLRDDSGFSRGHAALSRAVEAWLSPLDPHPDLPLRRMTLAERRERLNSRSPAMADDCTARATTLTALANRIVAASISPEALSAHRGDVVVDETEYSISATSSPTSGEPAGMMSASPTSGFVIRKKSGPSSADSPDAPPARGSRRTYLGIGVTQLLAIGPPHQPLSTPRVTIGIAVDVPDSGSTASLELTLSHARENGLLPLTKNRSGPFIVSDIGYSNKNSYAHIAHRFGLLPLSRYTEGHRTVQINTTTASPDEVPDGTIFSSGCHYCPLAQGLVEKPMVSAIRNRSISQLRAHNALLAEIAPLRMRPHGRVRIVRSRRGRPSSEDGAEFVYSLTYVCPAVAGQVACALKPESLLDESLPTFDPPWRADAYRACSNSFIRVHLSEFEFKRLQLGIHPASWEHAFIFEAYRSMNEGNFSLQKSPHMSSVQRVDHLPKRVSTITLIMALVVAATNLHIQDTFTPSKLDVTARRKKKLEKLLGGKLN